MFGYIIPLKNELKVKDFDKFRTYYCSICSEIKNKFGNIPRLGLNYDTTFFSILLDGLSVENSKKFTFSCIRHPLEKREFFYSNAISYASDLNISLIYYKLLDDKLDNKTIIPSLLLKILYPYYKKVTFKNIDSILNDNLTKLHDIEKSSSKYSLDEICHPFSDIIGKILKEYPYEINEDNSLTRNNLYSFGYSFGKWIYLIDALDDLKSDMQSNINFNPIEKSFNINNLSYESFIKSIKTDIDFLLIALISSCEEKLKKLQLNKNQEIIENVIKLGLMNVYTNIFTKL